MVHEDQSWVLVVHRVKQVKIHYVITKVRQYKFYNFFEEVNFHEKDVNIEYENNEKKR